MSEEFMKIFTEDELRASNWINFIIGTACGMGITAIGIGFIWLWLHFPSIH